MALQCTAPIGQSTALEHSGIMRYGNLPCGLVDNVSFASRKIETDGSISSNTTFHRWNIARCVDKALIKNGQPFTESFFSLSKDPFSMDFEFIYSIHCAWA